MSTLTKSKVSTKKPARARSASVIGPATRSTRTPPPAKSTAADLLKIKDFGKGLDGELVMQIVADRAR
jgi:hypothetical protein